MTTDLIDLTSIHPALPFDARASEQTLFGAVLAAARRHGAGKVILTDADKQSLTYKRLVLAALVLGNRLQRITSPKSAVGVLLPNTVGTVTTVLALNAYGRTAAMLNFTAGSRNLSSAVATGPIRVLLTSRRFIDTAKLADVIEALARVEPVPGQRLRIVYLEDVRAEIGWFAKLGGALKASVAARIHRRHGMRPHDPAVILFTSGTEGQPKGVVLSNANLIANAHQILAHAGSMLTSSDVVFNPLPMFHSFGLTAATIMPLVGGMRIALYPSPLHYRQVARSIRDSGATVLFATDTFLQGYVRAAEEGDLASIRYVIAGAERVKDQTRAMWAKTGATILEGYGATECAPVIACNLPTANRPGSVGPLLPGIEARLEPVEGIDEGGLLSVRGANVMLGYMLASNPGIVHPPRDGWHDTGDIVTLDSDRVVTIRGRAKRFAKIGGEMVSLAAVEALASGLWPDSQHVVVAIPDDRKGEQLVLVTDKPDADSAALLAYARQHGTPELWVPRAVMVVSAIPVMGSGKVDLPATVAMVRQTRPLL
ncbi:MAG: AMP-binding protein [Hyphomicrobiaceae bacterium]|nr:AMP-binding protein [Hyphomicrobiaceae bacterium]